MKIVTISLVVTIFLIVFTAFFCTIVSNVLAKYYENAR